jgi:hypothetical protein
VDDNTPVGVEANVNADANAIPASSKQKMKRGWPRKTTGHTDIEKVIKELLSDMEQSDSEHEDLFYNADEVIKENDGKVHWWEDIDLGVNETGADFGDKEVDNSSDGLGSLEGSDSDNVGRKKRYKQFNEKFDINIPITFELWEVFPDTYAFKRALKTQVVQHGYDYKFTYNDRCRVSALCLQENCNWRIHASTDATRTYTQIKTYYPTHSYGFQFKNSKCDVEYIVRKYKRDFKDDPTWTPFALKERVKRDLNINVAIQRCYRAKREALRQVFGSHSGQYRLTRRYANAIRLTNPGSGTFIQRDGPFFQRMYISLDACKKGFINGCRPVICLDACHLKGEHGGQLLCAIGTDGNDDIFPIAFAVAEAETRDSWEWFITIFLEDLCGPVGGLGWVIMSDRQKVFMSQIKLINFVLLVY